MKTDHNRFCAFTMLELLVVIAIIGILIALLLPAVQAARESARRMQCANNLSQIGLALKQYENANGVLPPGTVNEAGPIRNVPIGNHLGWIPRILAYMEQTPLYDKIDFDKGAYDPENQIAWLTTRPSSFCCPSDGMVNTSVIQSSYMACQGSEETPIDTTNNGVFFLNGKLRSRDIPDGAANTIWVGEAQIWDTITPEGARWGGAKFLLPEDGLAHNYVYAGLGWISGTPGTIRNTANPINTFVGPFSDWPMPFLKGYGGMTAIPDYQTFPWSDAVRRHLAEQQLELQRQNQYLWGRGRVETVPVMSVAEAMDESDPSPSPDPSIVWKEEKPGQFLVGGYGSNPTQGANFLFGDGAIHFLNRQIDMDVYHNLGNRADKNVVEIP